MAAGLCQKARYTPAMKTSSHLATALLLLSALLPAGAAPVSAAPITLAAARVLDVDSGKLLENRIVRVDNGMIVAVETRQPGQTVDFDLGDVTLLPGLIDAHTHLIGGEEETPFDSLRETAARAAIEGVANARKTLAAGFTTVRDLGSRDFADVALRDAIAEGKVPGPRMLVAVRSLSSTGGHGDRNDLPEDIHVDRFSGIADGPDAIRQKVRENVKFGANWIKILATGGVMSAGTDPRSADYTEEELRAAVEAAKEKGRDVAAHAHGTEGIRRAVVAGVRSIEHSSMLDDETIRLIKEKKVFVVPNPYTNAYMLERGEAGGYQTYQIDKAREIFKLKMASLRRAIRADLQVAYGTDAGVQPHGVNGKQFALYVEAGMTPLQAIQSATVVNARLLRMEGKIGTLKAGAFADLIAVRGNPLSDVKLLEQPVFVMKGGNIFAK
jgi:imidazolonepropionase-like amidohydrolase